MGKIDYTPSGVCSRRIEIEVSDATGLIESARVTGGCHGNLQGVCRLIEGRSAEEVVGTLEGIRCGMKETSCPDQIARALKEYIGK